MNKKILGIAVVVFLLGACSSPPVVPTLNGKKRERINTIVHDTPPFVVVPPTGTDVNLLPSQRQNAIKKKSIPVVTNNPVPASLPRKNVSNVVVDKDTKAVEVINIEEKPEIAKTSDTSPQESISKVGVNTNDGDGANKKETISAVSIQSEGNIESTLEKVKVEDVPQQNQDEVNTLSTDIQKAEEKSLAIPLVPENPSSEKDQGEKENEAPIKLSVSKASEGTSDTNTKDDDLLQLEEFKDL